MSQEQSRREFVALSTAAGLAVAAGPVRAAAMPVMDMNVQVKTPDGSCDAALIHPTSGTHPAVLIWSDVFGLRPALREMGKRMAAEGYTVLVPNPFYRTIKAPIVEDPGKFNFQTDLAKLAPHRAAMNAAGATERDAAAFVAYLDAQKSTDKSKKVGTQGYCMGGPLIMRTAAALPERIGAAASFHGGGLATNTPDSPHLLIPKMKARLLIAIAASDDAREPQTKDTLRAAFAAARVPAEVEVFAGTQHGWCMPDMPVRDGMPIYSQPDAEKAWARLLALYRTALV